MRCRLNLLLATTAMVPLGLSPALAGSPSLAGSALPQGGQVQAGSATVTTQGATLTITQTTNNAVINWNSFNIGSGGTVNINMPGANSVELDRVTGGLGPSQIFGSLNSNGTVFLVNPNGMLFGRNASVNAAGFLATTHDIANGEFMAGGAGGRYNFNISGNPAASIVNRGSITAASGGFAALVAPGVRNSGTITATLGTVGLASANGFTLDFYGDRLITLGVNDSIATQVMDVASGKPLSALVSNSGSGKLSANGGKVVLTAAAARTVVDSVINTKGVIEANAIGSKGGTIVLAAATGSRKPAGAPTQTVKVAGTLSATGTKAGQTGGNIKITGENIALTGATLDASGQAGGGTVQIGGRGASVAGGTANAATASGLAPPSSRGGMGWGPTASTVTIDAASVINASAIGSGNGGKVVAWANDSLTVAGLIKASGGAQGGNGGLVETSGGAVNFAGISVNTSAAPAGKTGTWLVDPTNLTVDSTAAATISSNLATTGVTLQTNANGTTSGPGTTSPGPGDIIVNAPISWASANTLTLNAYNAVTVNAAISITGTGGLVLAAANNPLAPGAPLLSFGNGASVQYTGTPNSGQSLAINGQPYTLLYTMSDVQNVNATSASLAGNYALAKPLNATGVASWTPIGTDGAGNVLNSDNGFAGTFQGLGNTISNLTINLPTNTAAGNYAGLFGYVGANGVIQNVGLSGSSVTGENSVGGLVGWNSGTISQSYTTVAVSGLGVIGGLVGYNASAVSQSSATGAVGGSYSVGGLIGGNLGAVSQSYATGPVNGASIVGGLAGENDGIVAQSYATGGVNGGSLSQYVGGLVGLNTGSVAQSYATGAVNGGSSSQYVGGLVGYNTSQTTAASVPPSYAAGATSGATPARIGATQVGGLLGINAQAPSPGTVTQSYATGAVSGGSNVGGLVGYDYGTISQTYATGSVTGTVPTATGGLVGLNDTGGSVSLSYWDTTTTGQTIGVGSNASGATFNATGLTTAQLQAALPAGFDPTVWGINAGASFPYLLWQSVSQSQLVNYSVANAASTYGTGATVGAVTLTSVPNGGTVTGVTPTVELCPGASTACAAPIVVGPTGTLPANTNAGSYTEFVTALGNPNYTIAPSGNVNGTLTINPAPLTVAGSKTYDGMTSFGLGTLTVAGGVNGETVTLTAGAGSLPSANAASYANGTLSNLAISVSGGNALASNYQLPSTGPLTINPATLTYVATPASSTYGAPISALTGSVTGFVNGETQASSTTGTLAFSTTAIPSSNVGNYPITGSGLTANNGNYVFIQAPANATAYTITSATVTAVTYAVGNASSTYGTVATVGPVTLTGVQNGDAVTPTVGVFSGTTPVTLAANTPAGSYTEKVTALSNPNYTIAPSGNVNGTLTINPATVTVTALGGSSTYGGSPANPGLSASGLQNGESVGVLTGLSNSFGITNVTNAGTYALNVAGTNTNTNYTVTSTVPGSWTVNPATLTYVANPANSTYGAAISPLTGSVTGFVKGQTPASATTGTSTFSTTATSSSNVGNYPITGSGLTANNGNYVIVQAPANATAYTINPATLTYVANAASSTYATAISPPTGSVTGFVNGQTQASATTGTLAFSTTATPSSNVGNYSITGSGLTANNGNYVFAQAPANATAYTITPAALTVVNYAVGNASSTYGTVATVGPVTLTGVQNGDVVTPTVGVFSGTTPVTLVANTPAASYTEKVTALNNPNYTIAPGGNVNGTLTINPAAVTVTALGGSSTYGGSPANPGVSATGLQNGEGAGVLTGVSNSFGITNLTNAGTYMLNVAGANTNPNYTVTSTVPGSWTVNPATLTFVANPASTSSGAATPALTGSVTGFVNGQTLASATTGAPAFSTAATPGASAGTYPITGSGLVADNGNYVFVQAPANATALTIAPAPAFVNASATSPTATGNFGVQQTAQLAPIAQPAAFNPGMTPAPLVTPIALGVPAGGGLAGGPGEAGGGPGAAGGGLGGPSLSSAATGTLANRRQGGNGAPPGVRLIDMVVMPLPPGSGMPPPGETRFSPNEVVLQFGAGATAQQIAQIGQQYCATLTATAQIAMLGRAIYTCAIANGRTVREVIGQIEARRLPVAVQPNYTYTLAQGPAAQPAPAAPPAPSAPQTASQQPAGASTEPNVFLADPAQYIVQKFQLGEVQRITKGDNVIVAVIDSEIDAMHPDLAGVVMSRYDAGCGASAPDAHGTGMTGAIASRAQLLGVAPNVKIIAVCAFGGAAAQATSSSINIINGLDYAITQGGARIVNMSFAGPNDKALAQALQVAREKDVLLVGAAGNAGPKSPPLYPGADPNVMAVTATDANDRLFGQANQGKYIAVAAPGVDVLVPAPNEGLQLTTGTSVATAEVSGVAALLIAQRPSRTPAEIRSILMSTAKHLGAKGVNPQFGAGLVDPLKALRLAPAAVSQIPAPAPVAHLAPPTPAQLASSVR